MAEPQDPRLPRRGRGRRLAFAPGEGWLVEDAINYRLSDDNISVFEPLQRNSGIVGGKLLEHMVCPKPGSSRDDPTHYGLTDFVIGKVLEINRYKFKTNDADVYVLNWVRDNRGECTEEQARSVESMLDPDASQSLGGVDRDALIQQVRDQLKFNNYLNYNNLEKSFRQVDMGGSGALEKAEVGKLCRKYGVSLDDELLSKALDTSSTTDGVDPASVEGQLRGFGIVTEGMLGDGRRSPALIRPSSRPT